MRPYRDHLHVDNRVFRFNFKASNGQQHEFVSSLPPLKTIEQVWESRRAVMREDQQAIAARIDEGLAELNRRELVEDAPIKPSVRMDKDDYVQPTGELLEEIASLIEEVTGEEPT